MAALFVLKIVLDEYMKNIRRLQTRLRILNIYPDVYITIGRVDDVNVMLLLMSLIPEAQGNEKLRFRPISSINLRVGKKTVSSYRENSKGKAVTKIRNYLNDCLRKHGYELSPDGVNHFDDLLGEVLNNAEDHSELDTWYAFGAFLMSNNEVEEGCMYLLIFNFGYSFYDGMIGTAHKNVEQTKQIQGYISKLSNIGASVSKEITTVLAALNHGYSRLKHIDESRGVGTMTFIESFLGLDAGHVVNGERSELQILSGNTFIRFDNDYPCSIQGRKVLALNSSGDLGVPPDRSKYAISKTKMPGTLLSTRLFLSQDSLMQISGNE